MARTRTWTLTWLAAVVCAQVLVAQAPPAAPNLRPLLGKVVDADGAPIPGAEVHCVLPDATAPRGQAASHVVVETDARGRFRTKVFPCTHHLVWAIGPAGEGRVTCAPAWTSSAELVELCLDQPRPSTEVKVEGLDLWQSRSPFRVRVAVQGVELPGYEAPLREDATCALPPLPAGRAQYDVLDKDGRPLWTQRGSTGARPVIRVPTPQEVPFRAVDEDGKPVAGAEVSLLMNAGHSSARGRLCNLPRRRIWRALGETDAAGRLVESVPHREDLFQTKSWTPWMFVARKQGRKISYSGFFQRELFIDGKIVAREERTELSFTLPKSERKAGTLRLSAERASANQPLMVRLGIRILNRENNGWTHESLRFCATTGADGTFSIPQCYGPVDEVDVLLRGDAPRSALMAPGAQRRTPARAAILHGVRGYKGGALSFTIGQLPKLELQLLDDTGGPARGADLLFMSMEHDAECDEWTAHATTDSAGRVAVLLQPGKWFVFGRTARHMVQLAVTLREDQRHELQLKPMAAMRGRFVSGDGAPIAGARLDVHSSSSSGGWGEPLAAIASDLNWTWLDSARTDASGEFFAPFLDLPNRTYNARFVLDDRRRSDSFRVEASEEPVQIVMPK